MTWNVLYEEAADNILKLVEELNPDILCCQEITTSSYINPGRKLPDEISNALGGEYRYLETLSSLNGHPGSMGNAIISKFHIVGDDFGMVQDGDSDISSSFQNRGYLEADILLDSGIIRVGTTHLSYVDGFIETKARSEEADKLLSFIQDKRYMVTGDFNSGSDSSTIKKLETRL